MSSAQTIFQLIGTGMVMGIIHVLTGPDHLSALATISSNVAAIEAFHCGVRWGIGHSIGVILVGTLFIILSYQSYGGGNGDGNEAAVDIPEGLETFLESIVGICMLGLGCYGIIVAVRSRSSPELNRDDEGEDGDDGNAVATVEVTEVAGMEGYRDASKEWDANERRGTRGNEDPRSSITSLQDHHHHHHHHHSDGGYCERCIDFVCQRAVCLTTCRYRPSKQVLSIGIGIVHGVAGPGGILGVIPAVQLHNWKLAMVYLGSFAVTSTLVMGIFAAMYGTCTGRVSKGKADLEFRTNVFSSCLSIVVGVLWLTLLSLGILHDIFP